MKKSFTPSLLIRIHYLSLIIFLLFGSVVYAQNDKMLIGDNNNGRIVKANPDGTGFDTISLGGMYQSFYDADVDPIHKKFYLAWYYGIYSMNYDGSDFQTLIPYPAGGYSSGIAVDTVNEHIYWGSTQEDKIFRANLDGTDIVPILSDLGYVGDIDIDLRNGYLFYSQYIINETKGIYRCDLNGTNDTTILSTDGVEYIGLDINNRVIYFSAGTEVKRINYDGSNENPLFSFQGGGFWVDSDNSTVYFTDITNNRVFRSDLLGGNAQDLITTQLESPHGPVLFRNCFTITGQPLNQNVTTGEDAEFILKVLESDVTFQWQTDVGFGFQDISNAGQYTGAQKDTLTVSNVLLTNNNQLFRCVINSSYCRDTTNIVVLTSEEITGIDDIQELKQLKIFPNPVSNYLNVHVNKKLVGADYSISDLQGKILLKGKILKEYSIIDLGKFSEGIFIIRVGNSGKEKFTLTRNSFR